MKNLYLIPTDKPSRLWTNNLRRRIELDEFPEQHPNQIAKHIYITSDSDFKEGDWIYSPFQNKERVLKYNKFVIPFPKDKKIILTTDQDLIKYGVQAIDDEFLEWFVKNPSCEKVEVKCYSKFNDGDFSDYKIFEDKLRYINKIIIPKEEPKQESLVEKMIPLQLKYNLDMIKQETLEEAADKVLQDEINYWYQKTGSLTSKDIVRRSYSLGITTGAKWQQERSYSEEDLKEAFEGGGKMSWTDISQETQEPYYYDFNEWFKQFKKK